MQAITAKMRHDLVDAVILLTQQKVLTLGGYMDCLDIINNTPWKNEDSNAKNDT